MTYAMLSVSTFLKSGYAMSQFVLKLATLAVLISSAMPVPAAEQGGEQLLFVSPPKWREVFNGLEENLSTTEYIPEADKEDAWTEMLTVQIVLGMKDANPETVLANVAVHLAKECHEFDAKPIALGGTGDYPTMGMMMLCGAHSESRGGEFSLLRGIAGKENFYLLRKTWRTETYVIADPPPIDLEDRKFWLGYLSYLTICDPAAGQCPERAQADE